MKLDELGERAAGAMLAAEDRRFFWHPGVDPFAIVRAMAQRYGIGASSRAPRR